MIEVSSFMGIPVGILGLGKSGLAAAEALARGGAEVMAWDDDGSKREAAAAGGVSIVDLRNADLRAMSSLVLSPGIPHSHPAPHPVVTRARDAGAEIIGDIELLARTQRDAAYIGITGTNGKSTTTALIGHILGLAGRTVAIGGNLGTPALALEPLGAGATYVLEMSSYQLELTVSLTFDVAVLLNITPDHLDRHGGMDGYIAAKKLIFHRQTKPRAAVIGVDDPICAGIHRDLERAAEQIVIPVSAERAARTPPPLLPPSVMPASPAQSRRPVSTASPAWRTARRSSRQSTEFATSMIPKPPTPMPPPKRWPATKIFIGSPAGWPKRAASSRSPRTIPASATPSSSVQRRPLSPIPSEARFLIAAAASSRRQ